MTYLDGFHSPSQPDAIEARQQLVSQLHAAIRDWTVLRAEREGLHPAAHFSWDLNLKKTEQARSRALSVALEIARLDWASGVVASVFFPLRGSRRLG
jgi:hypothetical protein